MCVTHPRAPDRTCCTASGGRSPWSGQRWPARRRWPEPPGASQVATGQLGWWCTPPGVGWTHRGRSGHCWACPELCGEWRRRNRWLAAKNFQHCLTLLRKCSKSLLLRVYFQNLINPLLVLLRKTGFFERIYTHVYGKTRFREEKKVFAWVIWI